MIDALVHAWIGLAILALIALAHGLIGGMPTVATLPTVQRSVVEYVDDPERTTITTWRVLPAERSRVPLDAAAALLLAVVAVVARRPMLLTTAAIVGGYWIGHVVAMLGQKRRQRVAPPWPDRPSWCRCTSGPNGRACALCEAIAARERGKGPGREDLT